MVAGVLLASALVACGGLVSQGGAGGATPHDAGSAGQGGGAGSGGQRRDASVAGQSGDSSVAGQAGAPAGDGGPDGSVVDATTACDMFTEAYCASRFKCEPFLTTWYFESDPQRCQDITHRWCRLSIEAHGSNTTPQWFADAAVKLQAISCTQLLYTAARYQTSDLPPGKLYDGAQCVVASQCASGVCEYDLGSACGICKTYPGLGTPCQHASDCYFPPYDHCIAGSCALGGELGHPCAASSPCMNGLTCTGGVCQITPSGGACPTYFECGGQSNGEFCNGGSCQPTTLVQPGDVCSYSSYCLGRAACAEGMTCSPAVPVGGACTTTLDCEDFSYCAGGICTEVPNDCP